MSTDSRCNNYSIPTAIINQDGVYAEIYGGGAPLVLIPGNRGAIPVFDKVIERLRSRYRLIAVDLPGHRFGPPIDNNFILDKQPSVDYILKAMDLAGEQSAHICGHSLGGMIAMEMGLQCKSRVRSVVALEAFAKLAERQNECFRMLAFPGSSEEMRYEVIRALQYGPGVLWHYDYDISEQLHALDNVLELIGEAEPHSAEQFARWKQRFRGNTGKNWRTKQVPHAGHFVMVENPDFVCDQIIQFVEEIEQYVL